MIKHRSRWEKPYWKQTPEERAEHRVKRDRDPKWYDAHIDDLIHFLADRIRDDDDEPVPFRTLQKLYKIMFNLIGDVLVEQGEVTIPSFGKICVWHKRDKKYDTVWFRPSNDLLLRMNETEEHLTLKTESVMEAINEERAKRMKNSDRDLARYYRLKAEKEKNDNENENENEE